MKVLNLKNSLVKCSREFFELDGITPIIVNELNYKQVANTTDNNKLELNNIYTIDLLNRLNNQIITISFLCNAKKDSHTYFRIESLIVNNRCYYSTRYFKKYIPLVGEIVSALRTQFIELN